MSNVLTGVVVEDSQLAASYLDVRQIAILASLLIPLAVSFLTKKTASDGIKALVNVIGSALVSALAIWINPTGQPVTVWLFVNTFLAALVASFVAYKAVWKPAGVTSLIADNTANIGLGSYVPDHAPSYEVDTVVDDDEHANSNQEDIGDTDDLDGDGIPDSLDVGNLEDLIAATPTEPEEGK